MLLVIGLTAACGGGGGGNSAGGGPFDNASWRLVTARDIQGGIVFSGGEGTLTIINDSGEEIEAPSLFVFNTETGEETAATPINAAAIADGETFAGAFTYPGGSGPAENAFFGLSLGDADAGQFFTVADFEGLPLTLKEGISENTEENLSPLLKSHGSLPLPTTGIWNFTMEGESTALSGVNCPEPGSAGFISGGDATLSVDCDGLSADLDADGSHISLDLMSLSTGLFRSPDYSFPVSDGETVVNGDNHFELTAGSSSLMSGELHWDNNLGCTADYPITMTLQTATSPIINDLCPGAWTLNYTTAVICGSEIINLSATAFAPQALGTLSTNNSPAGVPLSLNYDTATGDIFIMRQPCTNSYGNLFAPMVFGVTTDSHGNPVVVSLGFQGFSLTNSLITGMGLFTGIGPATACTATFPFTLEATGPC